MPATYGRKTGDEGFVLGVDGCRAGWIAAKLNLSGGALTVSIVKSFSDILAEPGAGAAMIIVDMPIGLAEHGKRACEIEARKLLKPLRHSSVFSAPRRPMLAFDQYAAANEWGKRHDAEGGGLSKQAWMITPKIREIDETITAEDQHHIGEGHPEIAFWRLNGGEPCRHPKRKPAGAAERLALLRRHGVADAAKLFEQIKAEAGSGVARDDVYDACALALTAQARLEGRAVHLSAGETDAKGLAMEIWG